MNQTKIRFECPLNEFTEHCTGDMPSMDGVARAMANPAESHNPREAQIERDRWLAEMKAKTE